MWNIAQDNSNEEIGGFKIPHLDNLWIPKHEGKQDLEGARLQQMLERICWKTNNEKNKLDMVLWNTSQIMRWQPATHGEKNWIDMTKETRKLISSGG